jgi:hypothetical protein
MNTCGQQQIVTDLEMSSNWRTGSLPWVDGCVHRNRKLLALLTRHLRERALISGGEQDQLLFECRSIQGLFGPSELCA